MDDSSKSKNSNSNLHLHDALKNINDALDEWDKITNKPPEEQGDSLNPVETPNQELLSKLRDQLNDLSKDVLPSTEETHDLI
jgi:hypothetical protein